MRKLLFAMLITLIILSACSNDRKLKRVSDSEVLDTSLTLMREIYSQLTVESCGEIAQRLLVALRNEGIKARTIIWIVDPSQRYETHVANELWLPEKEKWVYIDPTFNGYYRDALSKEWLDASTIRAFAADGIYDELEFVQNGLIKENYDIRNYYINPLRLTKVLIYRYEQKYYQIIDDNSAIFKLDNSKYQDFKEIILITDAHSIDTGEFSSSFPTHQVRWGITNYSEVIPINWEQVGNDSYYGTVQIKEKGLYTFETPLSTGDGMIEIQAGAVLVKDEIVNDQDQYYKSQLFSMSPGIVYINIQTDILETNLALFTKVENKFRDKVQFVQS